MPRKRASQHCLREGRNAHYDGRRRAEDDDIYCTAPYARDALGMDCIIIEMPQGIYGIYGLKRHSPRPRQRAIACYLPTHCARFHASDRPRYGRRFLVMPLAYHRYVSPGL